ncbi:hypothetical protein C7N43_18870 [Sphingobacteriales bacterium UPWRP_1]|nr:hypothetical protein C7N43_18870 [Sphingobacteriales bacterium UPWRP_1]
MRLLFLCAFSLMLFLAASMPLQNGISFQQEGNFETLMERVLNEQSFAFVHTTWNGCAPCNTLEQSLYPNPDVGRLYNANFINFRLNVDRTEYFNIANILNLGKNAALLYFEPNGQLIKKTENVRSADDLISNAKEVILLQEKTVANRQKLETLYRKANNELASPQELYECAYLLKTFNQPCSDVVNQYLQTQSDEELKSDENIGFIYDFLDNVETKAVDHLLADIQHYKLKYGAVLNEKLTIALYNSLRIAIQQRDDKIFQKIMMVIHNANLPHTEDLLYFVKAQYYENTKSFDKFAVITNSYVKHKGTDNPQLLTILAEKYFLYMNDSGSFKQALEWVNQAIKIDGANYRKNLIKARLLRKTDKNCETALNVALEARTAAEIENIDTKEVDDLIFSIKNYGCEAR